MAHTAAARPACQLSSLSVPTSTRTPHRPNRNSVKFAPEPFPIKIIPEQTRRFLEAEDASLTPFHEPRRHHPHAFANSRL
ncbi:hypothetical protein U9M48_035580 [Paspalum notatum var. saurae]|uniref:Uncharacterized protein n=1 Tax=Paspalum notatum var. saurae TaxID=547442 RepID=A0AAQ3UCX3_PASNO